MVSEDYMALEKQKTTLLSIQLLVGSRQDKWREEIRQI